MGRTVGRLVIRSVGRAVSGSIGWSVCQSLGQLVSQSVSILFRLQQIANAVPTVLLSCSLPDCPNVRHSGASASAFELVEGIEGKGKGKQLNSLAVAKLEKVQ